MINLDDSDVEEVMGAAPVNESPASKVTRSRLSRTNKIVITEDDDEYSVTVNKISAPATKNKKPSGMIERTKKRVLSHGFFSPDRALHSHPASPNRFLYCS